jgi:hypothetical protein
LACLPEVQESCEQPTFENDLLHHAPCSQDPSDLPLPSGSGGSAHEALVSSFCNKTSCEEIRMPGSEVCEEKPSNPGTQVQHRRRHSLRRLGEWYRPPLPEEATTVFVLQEEVRFDDSGLQSSVAAVQELPQKFQDLPSEVLFEADGRGFRLVRLQVVRAPELLGVPQVLL